MIALLLSATLAAGAPEAGSFTWTTSDGDVWTHATLIEHPEPGEDRGLGVMIFGGGYATDLHWTVPGAYEHNGETQPLTIDGAPTRDADDLAQAFLDAGFTVLRYSAIREGDPLRAENPLHAQTRPFGETLEMARAAWDAMLDASGFDPGDVYVVGHSMGATRGVLASGGHAAGYVLLAGAYVTPINGGTRRLAEEAADEPGEDFDGSGGIAGWERAAARALRERPFEHAEPFRADGAELAWVSDVLADSDAPVLALWGGLDTISLHGPVLEHLLGDRVETVYEPELGHALAPDQGGLTGPIDPRVVDRIGSWLADRASEE
ncbi:MAG: alpha/beta fold hydrolase [Phycisphaerales bacterium]